MDEFQTELLKALKGIQRELVILNQPDKINMSYESPKEKQIRLFLLEDLLKIYEKDLGHTSDTIRQEAIENYKETMKNINELSGVRHL